MLAGTTRPTSSGASARVAAASGSSTRTAPPASTTRTPRRRMSSGVPPLCQPSHAIAASRTVSRVPAPSVFTACSICRASMGSGNGPWSSRHASQAMPSASGTASASTPRSSRCAEDCSQPNA